MLGNRGEAGRSPGFFFIIGGQRCGSTMLRRALAKHPDIQILEPERPEPKSFLASDIPSSASQYAARFGERFGRVLGEKSTSYLDRPDSAAKIKCVLPGAKIIVILREPFARAVSHYRFSVLNGAETFDMERAFSPEAEERDFDTTQFSVSPFRYLARGLYADFLRPWVDAFGVSRIHAVVFEQLIAEPTTLARVHRFLGVEEQPSQDLDIVNYSRGPTPELRNERVRDIRHSFLESNLRLSGMFGIKLDEWQE